MMLVPVDVAMRHCKLELDDTDLQAELPLFSLYLGAAEQSAIDYLNRFVFATQEEMDAAVATGTAGRNPMLVNDAIRAAILLTVGHLYANREDVIVGVAAEEIPIGARHLLRPHRLTNGV